MPLPLPSRGTLAWMGGALALLWARVRGKTAGREAELKEQAKQAIKEGDAERVYDLLRRKGD